MCIRRCEHARMNTKVLAAVRLATVVSLLACGCSGAGGGSGGSGGGAEPQLLEPLMLSPSNALEVASTIWLNNGDTEAQDVLGDAARLFSQLFPVAAYAQDGVEIEVGCGVSGTAFVMGAVGEPQSPGRTAGDSLEVTYLDCVQVEDSLFLEVDSGNLTLVIDNADATSQEATFTIDMTTRIGSAEFSVRGTQQLTILREAGVERVTASADRLSVDADGAVFIATNYRMTIVDQGDEPDSPFEIEFATTSSDPRLGGSVTVETTAPFKGSSNGYPSEGTLLISGAADTRIRLTALDASNVHLELDADGDGVFEPENTVTITWFELEDGGSL